MDTLIGNASSTFASTVGFTPADAVTWTGSNLLKPFIGGGIDLLFELRYWIIALVVLSAIIYFAYRAFRFYRH